MGFSNYFKIRYLPVITSSWLALAFLLAYLTALLEGHVLVLFPYISDTATFPPESCIFAQMINIGAVLLLATCYLRYRQVNFATNSKDIHLSRKWNTVGMVLAFITCLGLSITANFQETNVFGIHLSGAIMAFGIGTLYCYLQMRISYAFRYPKNLSSVYKLGRYTFYFRVFVMIFLLPVFICHIVCLSKAAHEFTGKSMILWKKEDGGFQLRLAAAILEWLIALLTLIYTATLTWELKSLERKGIFINLTSGNVNKEMQKI